MDDAFLFCAAKSGLKAPGSPIYLRSVRSDRTPVPPLKKDVFTMETQIV